MLSGIGVVYAFLGCFSVFGQEVIWRDTVRLVRLNEIPGDGTSLINLRFAQVLEYSLNFSTLFFLNWQHEKNTDQLTILQNIRYQSVLDNNRNFKLSNTFVHNLGLQVFFDSVTWFQMDDNTLDTKLEILLHRNLSYTFASNLNSRIFNGYDYHADPSGNPVRRLNSAFLTPLVWTFSTGLGWSWPRFGNINFGISSARLTVVRDKRVYEESGTNGFYGVPPDKDHLFEYGLSMHLLVDAEFKKRIHWICDMLLFKNYNDPIDMVLKNLVDVRINKFLKTSIQTRLFYEERVSKNLQVENLISVGFFFSL